MAHLELTYFGTFQATLDGEPITRFRSANVEGLLAYLSLQPDRIFSRDALATIFWPDVGETVARRNLRQSIFQLRKVFGDHKNQAAPFILRDRRTVQFNPDSDYRLDVKLFREAIQLDDWEGALVHYNGELLPSFPCDSPAFNTWLWNRRERLQTQAMQAMHAFGEERIIAKAFAEAESNARRQLQIVPWEESGHRQLMYSLAAQGKRTEALTQYQICSKLLMEELGATPSPDLDLLYDRIHADEFDQSGANLEAVSVGDQIRVPKPQAPPFQAKPVPDYFIKRNDEIDELVAYLITLPATVQGTRIAALVGMGGAGKTTLASYLAYALRSKFADGILWANTTTSSPQDILELWGRAYGYDFSGLSDVESRSTAVRGMLAERSTLIILDNVEDAAHVKPLLPNNASCACLVTTRDLAVTAAINAHVAIIGELPPELGVELLHRILGKARVQSEPDAADEICQLLHNLPLAVEIAAQLLKAQPRRRLSSMAQRLQSAQNRLDLSISNLAVRTSFLVSWDALDVDQQSIFALLAAFEGHPFAAEAIAYIAKADPLDVEDKLYTLASLSLLIEEDDTYFRQHPLLADFAMEQLVSVDEAYSRLVEYYLKFAEDNYENYAVLEPEWGNLSASIEIAHRLEKWAEVVGFTDYLADAWITRARFHDAQVAFRIAVTAAKQLNDSLYQASLQVRWAEVCIEQGDYDAATHLLNDSLMKYEEIENYQGIANAKFHLASVAHEQNQFENATTLVDSSLDTWFLLQDELGISKGFYLKAYLAYDLELFDEALESAVQALGIRQRKKSFADMIPLLRLIALICGRNDKLDSALNYSTQALELSNSLRNEHEIAASLYTLTAVHRYRGDYVSAFECAINALAKFRHFGQKHQEGMLLYQISVVHKELEEFEEALPYAQKSIEIFQLLSDSLGAAYSWVQVGDLHFRLGAPSQAKIAWSEAQDIGKYFENNWLITQTEQRLHAIKNAH